MAMLLAAQRVRDREEGDSCKYRRIRLSLVMLRLGLVFSPQVPVFLVCARNPTVTLTLIHFVRYVYL